MPAPVLVPTMGTSSALGVHAECADLDLYALPSADLTGVRGMLLGAHVDQVFLRAHRPLLDDFVRGGGRLVVCGQVVLPFVAGLCPFAPLAYRSVADLTVHRLAEHPVWHGVDTADLTFRRGVAGFYGRGHYPELPASALVVHGLGPQRLPLDAVYPHGSGEVLVHGGNDLWGYAEDDTTAARMTPALLGWVLGR
ncbi:hypothetical protein [Pseudonocardia acaciae]|uniref:hypothetical protein n=1 Tax=Pseudonocardia acaciae TaxID=551276 RepID=UPI00055C04B7|nr:hypothetical protein [Pseudonocardia acaciae]